MSSQKKFYEVIDGKKRVAAEFSSEQIKQLRLLQLQHELSESDVILASVKEKYVRSVEKTAVETGILKPSALHLSRDDFADEGLFKSICLQLNVFGPDGKVDSVKQISLEVAKVFIPGD